jgi:hypothetical protein
MKPLLYGKDDDREIADALNRVTEGLSDRKTLHRFIVILGACNLVLWLTVLIFPASLRSAWESVNNVSGKIAIVSFGIPFGLGLYFIYSLFRLIFGDIEDQNIELAPMGSFNYHSHSQKRWLVWVFSVLGGVLNLLLLIVADLGLSGG